MLLSGPPQGFGRIRPLAEIQAKAGTGPPIKTFGGDALGISSHRCILIPRQLLRGSSVLAVPHPATRPNESENLPFRQLIED
jgi:hypothetical protein